MVKITVNQSTREKHSHRQLLKTPKNNRGQCVVRHSKGNGEGHGAESGRGVSGGLLEERRLLWVYSGQPHSGYKWRGQSVWKNLCCLWQLCLQWLVWLCHSFSFGYGWCKLFESVYYLFCSYCTVKVCIKERGSNRAGERLLESFMCGTILI